MIIKGRARGGSSQLAAYLMSPKNELATVLEVRGTAREDLRGALREIEAVGLNTTASELVLYHAQIAPAWKDELTPAQFRETVDRLEIALGFSGQPRAIVQHDYQGHRHLHVVWSRADVENSRVISNSWDRAQHHKLSRQLEREWGLQRVRSGYEISGRPRRANIRDAELRQQNRLNETAQAAGRSFRDKDLAREEISWCWDKSLDGHALAQNLKLMGYQLAIGRTGPIAFDQQNNVVYSIARLAEVSRDEVRAKCSDILESLPTREDVATSRNHIELMSRQTASKSKDKFGRALTKDAATRPTQHQGLSFER